MGSHLREAKQQEFFVYQTRTIIACLLHRTQGPVGAGLLSAMPHDLIELAQFAGQHTDAAEALGWANQFARLYRDLTCSIENAVPLNVGERAFPGFFQELAGSPDLRDHRWFLNADLVAAPSGINAEVLQRLRRYLREDQKRLVEPGRGVDVEIAGALATVRKTIEWPPRKRAPFTIRLEYPNVQGGGIGAEETYDLASAIAS